MTSPSLRRRSRLLPLVGGPSSSPLLFLACAASMAASVVVAGDDVLNYFAPSRGNPFLSAGIPTSSVPQFIVLTFDDSVTPQAVDLISQLKSVRHRSNDGCPVTATFYVSIAAANDGEPLTKCELITALRKGGHEIGTHSYGHTGDPTAEEIEGAVDFLADVCSVPREELRGFRTPYLQFTQSTFDRLAELGFLYDSSISGGQYDSDGGKDHLWPYTMDDGIDQDCTQASGSCDPSKSNPGLWEIPMWTMYDYGTSDYAGATPLIPMDYPGDAYQILQDNFNARYDVAAGGNRAPLGIFLHPSWMLLNGQDLARWAQDTLDAHNDVHFVTNYELLRWMSDPVPSSEYVRDCSGYQPECLPPPVSFGGCGHGAFDVDSCACLCAEPYAGAHCMEMDHNRTKTAADEAEETATPSEKNVTEEGGGSSEAAGGGDDHDPLGEAKRPVSDDALMAGGNATRTDGKDDAASSSSSSSSPPPPSLSSSAIRATSAAAAAATAAASLISMSL